MIRTIEFLRSKEQTWREEAGSSNDTPTDEGFKSFALEQATLCKKQAEQFYQNFGTCLQVSASDGI